MRHARRRLHAIVQLAAVGGLVCGGLMVSNAVASEPSAPPGGASSGSQNNALGTRLVSELGDSRTAGTWIGADGQPVVAVTDADAAAEVKEAGARAKVVRHNMQRLRSATESLSDAPRVPGTAWAMDYASNEIVVQADRTVSAADWSRMSDFAKELGAFVRMQRTTGTFTTRVNAAEPILAQGSRCSAGYNVTNGTETFILTAGHCGPAGTTWFTQGDQELGPTTTSRFPGADYALVQYQNGQVPNISNTVNIGNGQGVQINGAAEPFVGQQVFRSGSTTGLRDGKVTAVNATVNYPEGTVAGLIETTVCAEPGDSGGPLFAQGFALGVTSGGDGDCRSGGTTFFQPVTKAMAELGVSLTGTTPPAADTGQAPPNPAASQPAGNGANAPLVPGQANGPRVSSIIDSRAVAPGIVVIVISLTGLIATRAIWSAQDRREFRMHYNQSWS
ncbi:S1 family peptidase [Streptomyces sp. NPDC020681]|uniref:S1 family peptidase n=1 Tax=Streptomyces sp. NPDC020681 TaxID=3365083 RepID=UPI00378DF102